MEKDAEQKTFGPHALLFAAAWWFASTYTLLEVLRSSGSPYLIGGDADDWRQLGVGLLAYTGLFLALGLPAWWLLRAVLNRPWVRTHGAVMVVFLASWGGMKLLHALSTRATFVEGIVSVGAFSVVCLGLAACVWRRVSPTLLCSVGAVGSLAAIAALYQASRLFMFEPNRVELAGVLAISWGTLVALVGMLGVVAARRFGPRSGVQLFLVALLAATLPVTLALVRASKGRTGRPATAQLVLVTCDALRADCASFHGGPVPTPHLDTLAAEGFAFEKSYPLGPWTVPSMCGLFSGKYPLAPVPGSDKEAWARLMGPHEDMMTYWLDEDGQSVIERIRLRNFETAALVANPCLGAEWWLMRGFEDWLLIDHMTPEVRGYLWRFPALQAAVARFFPALQRKRPVDTTRVLRQYAVEFLHQNAGRDYFLWVHLMDPHCPYDPPERFRRLARPEEIVTLPSKDYGTIIVHDVRDGKYGEETLRKVRSMYEGEVRYADEAIGAIHRELEKHASEATYLCVTADHGEETWDHGGWGHGHSLYEEVMHVPLVFWGQRVETGETSIPVSSIDLLPTLAQLMNESPRADWRGMSLLPYLRGSSAPTDDRPVFFQGHADLQGVVSGQWKLIRNLHTGAVELYDLEADPLEEQNVADQHPQEVARLSDLLTEWSASYPVVVTNLGDDATDGGVSEESLERLKAMGYLD